MRRHIACLADLIYPPTCCACAAPAPTTGFCAACAGRFRFLRAPLCPVCGIPFRTLADRSHRCSRCLLEPPSFRAARACLAYESGESRHPLAAAIQQYKYERDVSIAPILSELLIANLPVGNVYDVIVPVPLHRDRLRWRGFNQSLLLARRVGRHLGIRVEARTLKRCRATQPQVELGELARRNNVRGAFAVDQARVKGRTVLLVDDVLTTGATVNECSRTLLAGEAKLVDVLTLARVVMS